MPGCMVFCLFVCLFVVLMCVVVVVTCYYMSNENGFQSFYTLIYLDENCFESIHYNYGNSNILKYVCNNKC